VLQHRGDDVTDEQSRRAETYDAKNDAHDVQRLSGVLGLAAFVSTILLSPFSDYLSGLPIQLLFLGKITILSLAAQYQ
jgi:hypothetical protein